MQSMLYYAEKKSYGPQDFDITTQADQSTSVAVSHVMTVTFYEL